MIPAFYTIFLDPSAPHLPLPRDYDIEHLENKGPIIVSADGGNSWSLKIEQIGDSYCFTDGWNNVVKDVPLDVADFLFFSPVNRSTINLSIYSPNGCQKLLPPKVVQHDGGRVDEEKNEDVDDPSFDLIITKTHKNVLRFPSEFSEMIGMSELIGKNREGEMTLKNLEGKEWVTALRWENAGRTSRFYLSTGWRKFWSENGISKGDKCVFKFIRSEGKLLLAKVFKKEAM